MFDKARLPMTVALVAALALTAGCTRVRDHKGYIVDQGLIDTVQPGIDNRESVQRTLGLPSFVGEFDKNSWYYVSRETSNFGFSMPKPSKQTLLMVRFNATGDVVSVQKHGMEQVASIRPNGDKTPTLGRQHGFLRELFGNIGQVGSVGQSGGTVDNPN